MRYRVTLSFIVDDEDTAWEVADGLEQAAIRKNYREVNCWAEPADGRAAALGDEDAVPKTAAETVTRRASAPMGFGGGDGEMITLGGDDGRSG